MAKRVEGLGHLVAAPVQASLALRGGANAPPSTALATAVPLSSVRSAAKPRPKNAAPGGTQGGRSAASRSTRVATADLAPRSAPAEVRIGVISDNHGFLDPEVLEIFAGVIHIIHAGDIVDPEIIRSLETVAPVTAVAGNMDSGEAMSSLPRDAVGEAGGVRFLVGHKRKRLLKDLAAGRIAGLTEPPDLVVYGHDHVPAAAWVDTTLYLNPGSASAPHEEDDGPTVAIVSVRPAGLAVCFVPIRRRDAEPTTGERPRKG